MFDRSRSSLVPSMRVQLRVAQIRIQLQAKGPNLAITPVQLHRVGPKLSDLNLQPWSRLLQNSENACKNLVEGLVIAEVCWQLHRD